MKKKKLNYNIALLTLSIFSLFACETHPEAPETVGLGGHEIAVELEPVVQKAIGQPITGSGLIFSDTEARLSFKIGGIIERIYVEEGQSVRKGQLLAKLDLTEISAQVTQALNSMEKAERDLQRIQNLYEKDAATLENVQDLTTALNVAKETHRIASFNQRYAEIRATTSGKIIKKLMNEGELAAPGQPAFYMIDNRQNQWNLEIGLADKDWVKIGIGDLANIQLDAYPGENFQGKIIRMAEGADPSNGTYKVEIQVDPAGKRFAAGLYAEASIKTKQQQTYPIIPIEALVEGHGRQGFVFVPDESKGVRRIAVEIALILDQEIALANSLTGIPAVITKGAAYLTDYSTIKIITPEEGARTAVEGPSEAVSLAK